MRLNSMKSEYNMTQNTKMMDQFIKAQNRRDLDPALMDIPTFSGDEPEKCLEWVTRIKNVCRQSGCSFQQELTNKSGLVGAELFGNGWIRTFWMLNWYRRSSRCLVIYLQQPGDCQVKGTLTGRKLKHLSLQPEIPYPGRKGRGSNLLNR